jgi:hypothetical protein
MKFPMMLIVEAKGYKTMRLLNGCSLYYLAGQVELMVKLKMDLRQNLTSISGRIVAINP